MITIYGVRSPFVYRVRAALIFKDLPFQHVDVNLANRSDEFRNLTMVGKIPVLEDEDKTVVWDSKCIVSYLDRKYPDTYKMMGNTEEETILIEKVLLLLERIQAISRPLYYEKMGLLERFKESSQSFRAVKYDEKATSDAMKVIQRHLDQLHQLLNFKPFFTESFSAADAAMLSTLQGMSRHGLSLGDWQEFYDNCMNDEKIRLMFTPEDVEPVRAI